MVTGDDFEVSKQYRKNQTAKNSSPEQTEQSLNQVGFSIDQ